MRVGAASISMGLAIACPYWRDYCDLHVCGTIWGGRGRTVSCDDIRGNELLGETMKALSYQEVYLQPRLGVLNSRADADLSVKFLGRTLKAPWIPANMSCVISPTICKWLSENDYPYIMHRFGHTLEFVRQANIENWRLISISVGVGEPDKALLRQLAGEGLRVDWICIDIAHGHCLKMKDMIDFVSTVNWKGDCPFVIAGNVASPEAVTDLDDWGADCAKINIGPGTVCSTKTQTGFHIPTFSCALNCCKEARIPVIADGGVREPGDIAKALVAGAQAVMIGGLLAGCIDAPGESVYEHEEHITRNDAKSRGLRVVAKLFHGSASEMQKGHKKHVEGFQVQIPCNNMTYAEYYQHLSEALSSAVSYAGGKDLKAFGEVKWVEA